MINTEESVDKFSRTFEITNSYQIDDAQSMFKMKKKMSR